MALSAAIILSGLPHEHFDAEFDSIINPANILKPNNPTVRIFMHEKHIDSASPLVDILELRTPSLETNSPLILEIQQIEVDTKSENNEEIESNFPAESVSDYVTQIDEPITSQSVTEPESHINSVLEVGPLTEINSNITSTFGSDSSPSKPASDLKAEPEKKSESICLIDFESEVTAGISSQPALESTFDNPEPIRDLMSEPVPQLAAKIMEFIYKSPAKYLLKEELTTSPTMRKLCTEAAAYYLDCFDKLERRFKTKNVSTTNSFVFRSTNKEILYQDRNILDLASNVAENSMWKFQYAILENGISSFFENRSQISRIYGAETPSYRMNTCRVGDCNYQEPIFL